MLIKPIQFGFDYFDVKGEILDLFNLNIEDVYFRVEATGFDPKEVPKCDRNCNLSIYIEWIAPVSCWDTYIQTNRGLLYVEFKGILVNLEDALDDYENDLTAWVARQKFLKFVHFFDGNGGGNLADSTNNLL